MRKNDKIQKVRNEIEATQKIMAQNIEKIIVRGKKIETLQEKSIKLRNGAQALSQNATNLKRKLQWRNIQLTAVIVGFLVGALGALASGAGAIAITLYGASGALLCYFIAHLASEIKQKLNPLSISQWGHSPHQESKVHSALRKLKGITMAKKGKNKEIKNKANVSENDDGPLTPQEQADLDKIKENMAAIKQLEAQKAQALIERGQLLDQVTGKTTQLQQATADLNKTTLKVERIVEAKNHHLNSILIGMAGVALGAGYGFLMGYSWPLMIVFGILAGSLAYGLSTFASKIWEKLVSVGDWFRSFRPTQFGSSPHKTYELLATKPLLENDSKTMLTAFNKVKHQPLVQVKEQDGPMPENVFRLKRGAF